MRLYVPFVPYEDVLLTSEQLHHLSVRRFNEKRNQLAIFCQDHGDWVCEWVSKNCVRPVRALKAPSPFQKRCFSFGIPKSQTLALIIEKGVELGVSDFYPLYTDHSQNYPLNQKRFNQIMVDALEQCERHHLPCIHPTKTLVEFFSDGASPSMLCAMERTQEDAQESAISIMQKHSQYGIMIGPEGGWSKKERTILMEKTCVFSLGQSILRMETASIVSLGMLGFAQETLSPNFSKE